MAMTTIDLRTRPSQPIAADNDPAESIAVRPLQSPHFEIPVQLWVLLCVAGGLVLMTTIALFLYGQGSVGM